jgi:hypothetical protein
MLNKSPNEEGLDIASGFIMKLLDMFKDAGFDDGENDGLLVGCDDGEIDGLLVG